MTTQFLSRTERSLNRSTASMVGPGDYELGSTLKKQLPSFAPFSSNAKRTVTVPNPEDADDGPAPGSYDLAQDLIKKTNFAPGTYASRTERFTKYNAAEGPGPGSYTLPSTFKTKGGTAQSRMTNANSALMLSVGAADVPPPSIPTRFQSYGYEAPSTDDGMGGAMVLKPQQPLYPVYKGDGDDRVGPCEYDPKIDVKFQKAPTANFSKSAARNFDKQVIQDSAAPGPGYYNFKSDFDLPEQGNTFTDTNFLMQLNAARQRQTSVFQSRTKRNGLMGEVMRRIDDPGPGQYDPNVSSIKLVSKIPAGKQNFSSTGPRFEDPLPKSMRLTTAPGAYNPITSDFDQARLKVLKKKKMTNRSGWAQTIAFTTTESRFFKPGGAVNEVPPASKYYPQLGMSATAPKQNPRAGGFGSTDSRFKPKKDHFDPIRDPYHLATTELNKDLAHILPATDSGRRHTGRGKLRGGGSGPPQSPPHHGGAVGVRPRFSTVFGPPDDQRIRPAKTPPGPAPGEYDTHPRWDKANTIHLMPSKGQSRKIHDPVPGPGQYTIARNIGDNRKNRKNIMLSTERRELLLAQERAPGPGQYDPIPMEGSLLRQSHNVLLSAIENY